jgi:hypothetical protein
MTDSPTLAASTIWMRGFLPNGRQLSITALPTDDFAVLIQRAIALDAAMTAAGLSIREPGLSEGELRADVYHISRREFGDDNIPLIDLYQETHDFAFLKDYLNNATEITAFETATGLKLDSMPINPTRKSAAQRSDKHEGQYVVTLPRPVSVVYKHNPKHDPKETDVSKKKPQYLFVRWANAPQAAPAPTAEPTPELRVVEKPATTNGNNDALVSLRMRVLKHIDPNLTDVQIAALAGIKAFSDVNEWKAKHGTLDKAFNAIKTEYEFEKLGDVSGEF